MSKIDHIMVISHTHWDPEWYSTFEEYRMRLVDLMDKLLDILENIPEYHSFMFDGQMSPLESYLQLFPENRNRIKKLVKSRKLFVGPWFILPDEYMIGPEAHIRNLLFGTQLAQSYGDVMRVGYLPDMAGHISQMPQILKGFGIGNFVGWRGIAGYPDTVKTEFIWKGADGTEVLAIHLPWGYSIGTGLFDDAEFTFNRIQELKKRQEERAATSLMLLMNGSDHEEPHPALPEVMEKIREKNPDFIIEHTSMLEYIKAIKKELKNPDIHTGEMRRTETSLLMSGILATRVPVKQENNRTEVLLEKYVEPLCTNAYLVGKNYPERLISATWRYNLENNFHDDIYGAHVDEVTPDVMNRYKHTQEIGNRLTAIAAHGIAERVNTAGWHKALLVFNPTSWDRSEVVEATIDFPQKENIRAFRITNNGEDVPFQILDCQNFTKYQSERNIMDGMFFSNDTPHFGVGPVRRYRIVLLAEDVPAFGYHAYRVEPTSLNRRPVFSNKVKVNNRVLENDYIRVEVGNGGHFTLTHKPTGQVYGNCNILEDGGDVGDNYTYQAPFIDQLVSNLGANDNNYSIVEKGPIRGTVKVDLDFTLPASSSPDERSRSEEKVVCPLSIYISLNALSCYVSIGNEFNNKAKDHRLRASFRPQIPSQKVYVDGHFDILTRDVELPQKAEWTEKLSPTQPQRNFVTLRNETRGLAILNKGLIQYEATSESHPALYITLLRCIGYLSKGGLEERNGRPCGPGLPTPTAQCIGQHTFKYAVYPYDPSETSLPEIHQLSHEFNAPLKTFDTTGGEGPLPQKLSFCRVKGALASAYKKAENGDDVILRLYNISDQTSETEVEFFRPPKDVAEVALSETPAVQPLPLKVSNNKISLSISAKKLITLRITFKEGEGSFS